MFEGEEEVGSKNLEKFVEYNFEFKNKIESTTKTTFKELFIKNFIFIVLVKYFNFFFNNF